MSASSEMSPAVLIVEDEYMVAMHMSLMISDLGYRVIGIAVDRESALKMAAHDPDIVLVDCKLRDGVTGPAIGKQIAKQTNASIIYITANPQYVNGQDLVHPAILGIYPKPVNDNDIGELLEFAWATRSGQIPASPPSALQSLTR